MCNELLTPVTDDELLVLGVQLPVGGLVAQVQLVVLAERLLQQSARLFEQRPQVEDLLSQPGVLPLRLEQRQVLRPGLDASNSQVLPRLVTLDLRGVQRLPELLVLPARLLQGALRQQQLAGRLLQGRLALVELGAAVHQLALHLGQPLLGVLEVGPQVAESVVELVEERVLLPAHVVLVEARLPRSPVAVGVRGAVSGRVIRRRRRQRRRRRLQFRKRKWGVWEVGVAAADQVGHPPLQGVDSLGVVRAHVR